MLHVRRLGLNCDCEVQLPPSGLLFDNVLHLLTDIKQLSTSVQPTIYLQTVQSPLPLLLLRLLSIGVVLVGISPSFNPGLNVVDESAE